MLLRVRKIEKDALAGLDGERDAAVLEEVEGDVVADPPELARVARAEIRQRVVTVNDGAVVSDQNGVERGLARGRGVSTEDAQQDAILTGEDLLEAFER